MFDLVCLCLFIGFVWVFATSETDQEREEREEEMRQWYAADLRNRADNGG